MSIRDANLLQKMAKRTLDILGSLIGLVLLSPVMFVVAIVIYLKMGSPVFFRQVRPGYLGKTFVLYKFRTMLETKDEKGNLEPDAGRLTRFGRFLRSTSLDEAPELLNVLRGEMSLVGPRPLLVEYLTRYSDEQKRRHDAKPGITGWAQVHGRNAVSWEDRFRLDLWYISHWSFWLDLKILILTIVIILKREGITSQGHVTMPEFLGSGSDLKKLNS